MSEKQKDRETYVHSENLKVNNNFKQNMNQQKENPLRKQFPHSCSAKTSKCRASMYSSKVWKESEKI